MSHVFLGLLASYCALAYSQNELVFGLPFHNRKNHRQKSMLGVFTSVSPMAVNVATDQSFVALVQQLAAQQKNNLRHQRYPIGHLNNDLKSSDKALYDLSFNYLKLDSDLAFEGQSADLVYLSHNHEATPLSMTVWAYGQSRDGEIQLDYNQQYFAPAEIQQLAARLGYLLEQLLNQPEDHDINVAQLNILPDDEQQQLIRLQHHVAEGYPQDQQIHQLFEAQAQKLPDNTAVVFKAQTLSYVALNEAANRLAHYLTEQGVSDGIMVGLCFNRTPDMLVTMLAILKAGGAYVPLDPAYPEARLQYMVNDTGLAHLLSLSDLTATLTLPKRVKVLELDSQSHLQTVKHYPITNLNRPGKNGANSLAFVLYTSGSTGQPKGVLIPHLGVVRMVIKPHFMTLDASVRFLHTASISFDAATMELWAPLLNGGCSVIYGDKVIDPIGLNQLIADQQVNCMLLTTALFEQWSGTVNTQQLSSLRWILSGGEVMNPLSVSRVQQTLTQANVINAYGPTENTTLTSCHLIPAGADAVPTPIGRAINGTGLYILSPNLTQVPYGGVGELYVSGDGFGTGLSKQP